ncbi:protein MLN51 homolog [Bidens hawaiensis]|uniref:protein MLN51 homolog n=1 Tax=Bidens hawaiensis TaxID=980011 RepID=UPI00404A114E
MADLGEEEEDEYESDPEQAKLSLTMRRRMEASDDEDADDDDDVSDARVRVRVSDYESDGQGAAAEYDDEEEEELELVEEEVEGVVESVDRFDNNNNSNNRNGSGGVEEGEGEGRQEEKKENEPFAVPTAGAFYMHDDRFRDSGRGRGRGRNRRTFGGRKLWELRDERKWGHDKFEEVTTQDRRYHENRRVLRGRNRGRGRNLGEGRGFSRNYDNSNNNNNNQTTGPKSVRGRGPRRYQPFTQNTFVQPPAQSRQHAKPMEKTSHASSGRATAAPATSASESAHGFVRKNVVASSLNSASLPFYPSGSSNKESKSGSVTRGPRPHAMSENYPVSQSSISQGRNVSVSLGMDKLYIDDPISKPMNSQTRAHGRGSASFGQEGHQSVPFSQQFKARSARGPQAFSPPKTSDSARGLESIDMESSTESNDFKAVLGLRGKGSIPSSGTGPFSYGDQNFSGAPRFLPVMQFAGQHPHGLGVPAVGMAFPGYVGQPDGMGNSEMTWLPVLAGAAGALGAAGLNAPYHPYITMDGSYNARPSGQLASLAHPINKDSNINKSSSEVKPYQKPEIEKDELRLRQNKARRYTEMKFDK